MSGFGMGIGSFMDGLVKGVKVGDEIEKNASDIEYKKGILGLQRNQDRRAQEQHDLQTQEYNANAPLRAAQRNDALGKLGDADAVRTALHDAMDAAQKADAESRQKNITQSTDAQGKSIFSVIGADGETFASKEEANRRHDHIYGTIRDRFNRDFAPKVHQAMLRAGDVEGANTWQTYSESQVGQKNVSDMGRLQAAAGIGDVGRVRKTVKEMVRSSIYALPAGSDIDIEEITDGDKKGGLRLTFKDGQTGQSHTNDYGSIHDLTNAVMAIANPVENYKRLKGISDAANAAKVKQAEEASKATLAIKQKIVESGLKMDEEAFKHALENSGEDPDEMIKFMKTAKEANENIFNKTVNGKMVPMNEQEMVDTARAMRQRMINGGSAPQGQPAQGAPQGQPAQAAARPRVLMSRPVAPPTPDQLGVPAPQARRAMETRQGRSVFDR